MRYFRDRVEFLKTFNYSMDVFFRNIVKILKFVCLSLVTFLVVACDDGHKHGGMAPSVEVMSVHKADVPISFDYAARIAPFKETQVRSRVSGVLLHRYFQEGSYVKKGEILFDIDPQAYELAVVRAQAQVAQALVAYRKAERDAERAGQLVKQNVQAPAFKEQALAEQMAKKALLRQAEAELSTAELNLTYTKVRAPISGITSREAVAEGSLIGPDVNSSLLTTIIQIDPVYVNFSYSDYDAKQMKFYLEHMSKQKKEPEKLYVAIFLGDDKLYPQTGLIDFTAPTLDSSTGTVSARAIVDNKEHSLIPGQFVRVQVLGLKRPNSIAIPEGALMQDGLGAYVFVVKEIPNPAAGAKGSKDTPATITVAMRRDVKVARQLANRDWLLEDAAVIKTPSDPKDNPEAKTPQETLIGLKEGEKILTKGHVMVQSGLTAMGPAAVQGMPVQITSERPTLKEVPLTVPKAYEDDKAEALKNEETSESKPLAKPQNKEAKDPSLSLDQGLNDKADEGKTSKQNQIKDLGKKAPLNEKEFIDSLEKDANFGKKPDPNKNLQDKGLDSSKNNNMTKEGSGSKIEIDRKDVTTVPIDKKLSTVPEMTPDLKRTDKENKAEKTNSQVDPKPSSEK